MKNKIKWCLKLKKGIRVIEPNETISKSYFIEAKASLKRAEQNFKENDLLWATVVIYYAEYYALYAFLQRIGIKSENHFCSISAVALLLGEESIKTILNHRNKRIDAQYYIKAGKYVEVSEMLIEAKQFVSFFDNLTSNLKEKKIQDYRKIIIKISSI